MLVSSLPLIVAALLALCLMPLVIRLRGSMLNKPAGVQDVHVEPTSRLGGVVVFVGYAGGLVTAIVWQLASPRPLLWLTLCALPVFGAGVWEDVTRRLPPIHRLIAAFLAALLACFFADGTVARIDTLFIDQWIRVFPALAIALTCFMVAGACNAFNIIDGANGLAAGTFMMMMAGIAGVAAHVGDQLVLVQALSIVGALAGFLFWNYPRARVFLGDGGAYLAGFIYAELAILLVARNDHVSAWFVIMLAAYPIVETLASMFRRKIILHTPSTQPDVLHLHSLIFRKVTMPAEVRRSRSEIGRANARVAPIVWIHGALCTGVAILFHDNTIALLGGLALYVLLYVVHYRVLWEMRPTDNVEGVTKVADQSELVASRAE